MGKRIKRVFSTGDQVLHLWANQSQSDARSRNVFFEGDECFSYGRHYTLGKLYTVKGKHVAIVNSYKYSVTTRKHQSWAESACSHMPTLRGDPASIPKTIKENKKQIKEQLTSFFRRRRFYAPTETKVLNQWLIKEDIPKYNNFCKAVGKPQSQIKLPKALLIKMQAHVTKCIQREKELNSPEALEKKRLASIKKAESDILKWRQGGALSNTVRDLKFQLIRINGNEVQTSKGASVPLEDAKQLLHKILCNKAKQGDKVGAFKLSSAACSTSITIGCHVISIDEATSVLGQ